MMNISNKGEKIIIKYRIISFYNILSTDVLKKNTTIANISKENSRLNYLLLFNIYISCILHNKYDCI